MATLKQTKFTQKFLQTGNASEAYRFAYNTKNMSDVVIWNEASVLLKNRDVAVMIEKGQEKARKRHEVTLESITKELEEARLLAMTEKQTSSAVSASLGKAKIHGLVVEKREVKISPLESILSEIDGQTADLPEDKE